MLDCVFNNAVKAIVQKLIFCTFLQFVGRRPEFESHSLFLLPLVPSAGAGLLGGLISSKLRDIALLFTVLSST